MKIRSLAVGFLCLVSIVSASAQTRRSIVYLSYADAAPVIERSGDLTPSEFRHIEAASAVKTWDTWARRADSDIRARLERGDEDSIVNLALFGTSYTKQPRITEHQITALAQASGESVEKVFQTTLSARLSDLIAALSQPSVMALRLSFAREHISSKLKVSWTTAAGKQAVMDFLLAAVRRVFTESQGFNDLIQQAKRNQEDVFAARSQMFARRGLSSDTQLKPNLAIENALRELKSKGLITKVQRVAIIGPGLDFTDKEEGYDFYPPQTIQPFAVIESLLRLALADKASFAVDTYDLSPKVNSHIQGFAVRARRGESYPIILPLDKERKFTPDFLKYWQTFGNIIGTPGKAVESGLGDVDTRTVNIRSEFLTKVHAYDTNIVLQHPVLADAERYDLVIGTNIFLYYSPFEQGLAMRNLNAMLKPGAMLLSNNALVEFPFTPIHSTGYTPTTYSAQQNDADAIVWYQKSKP